MRKLFEKVVCTQTYLFKGKQVCLPLKKRGFGMGWYNGYGGKVEHGESLEDSAKRELFEESGVKARSLEKRAILNFVFLQTGKEIESHVYWCEDFIGELEETDEMKPFWFGLERIPYKKMWPDDRIWFPKFLTGEKFEAKFEFLDEKPTLGKYEIKSSGRI